jgi:hypothetical protein
MLSVVTSFLAILVISAIVGLVPLILVICYTII